MPSARSLVVRCCCDALSSGACTPPDALLSTVSEGFALCREAVLLGSDGRRAWLWRGGGRLAGRCWWLWWLWWLWRELFPATIAQPLLPSALAAADLGFGVDLW